MGGGAHGRNATLARLRASPLLGLVQCRECGDGVAANIVFGFPGSLRQAVLEAGPRRRARSVAGRLARMGGSRRARFKATGRSPRTVHRAPGRSYLVRSRPGASPISSITMPCAVPSSYCTGTQGATSTPRVALLSSMTAGSLTFGASCVHASASASPPERLPSLLEEVRAGTLVLDLPPRLAIFGVTTLPSGAPFVELVEAASARREVHLLLLDPSPPTTARVREATLANLPPLVMLRSEDASDTQVRQVDHPLLRSWGAPYRERAVLLAAAEGRGFPTPSSVESGQEPVHGATGTLLARLQDDLRSGSSPAGDFELCLDDRSVQVHSCHGQARQVQVLRDVILHLLDDDPTLAEEDIAVLTPAIDQFAPLVEAGFGVSAAPSTRAVGAEIDEASSNAPPRLRYRITDRSLRESHPALAALDSLLALVSGRFSASEVLEFISLPLVRSRFELDDEALATIATWAQRANVRWGLNGAQRAPWGLPTDSSQPTPGVRQSTACSWEWPSATTTSALVQETSLLSAWKQATSPSPGDSLSSSPAWRLSPGKQGCPVPSLLGARRCRTASASSSRSRMPSAGNLTNCAASWPRSETKRWSETSRLPSSSRSAEIRRLLGDRLQGSPPRSDFFRGGITVSSLTPLRWLPFRVVCLLGLDDAGTTGSGTGDGDDLAALAPLVGDHDPRSEVRQALLEAILAAGDHLVITRMGRSVRTNREVPRTTVLAELRDTIEATLSPRSRSRVPGPGRDHPPLPALRRGQLQTPRPRHSRALQLRPRGLRRGRRAQASVQRAHAIHDRAASASR